MKRVTVIVASVVITAAVARAQPVPDVPIPDTGSGSGSGSAGSGDQPTPIGPTIPPQDDPPTPADPYPPATPPKPKLPLPPQYMPEVLTTPTGFLLRAAVLYSKTSLDTGGGVTSDTRVGLGDVAEFGIATTDQVRERPGLFENPTDETVKRIQPYITASFRLGVQEDQLFKNQPGVTLGFRKSFERNHDSFTTRIAELTLVASRHFGSRNQVTLHLGGAFWDASLAGKLDRDDPMAERRTVTLHDQPKLADQIRVFGGLEVSPLPRSQILIDVGWAPEFCYLCAEDADKITLKPVLSWGVRYEVAPFMRLESGVRLPDIGEANLLEAQIFGQVTFTSFALHRAINK